MMLALVTASFALVALPAFSAPAARSKKTPAAAVKTGASVKKPAPAISAAPKKQAWQIFRLRYKTYVSARAIADFYRLKYTMSGKTFKMSGENLVIEGKTDSPVVRMNGIQFRLSSPPTTNETGVLIDKTDLVTLFSPLLAPDTRSWQDGADGVLVDLLPVHALAGNKGAAEAKKFRQQLREALQSTFDDLKIPVHFLVGEEASSLLRGINPNKISVPALEAPLPGAGSAPENPAETPPAPVPEPEPSASPGVVVPPAPLPAAGSPPAPALPVPAPVAISEPVALSSPAPLASRTPDPAPAPTPSPPSSPPSSSPVPLSAPEPASAPAPPPVPAPALPSPLQRNPAPPPFKSPLHLVVKLRLDAKKPELRTVLLAPPGEAAEKSQPNEIERRVFLGNLRDSENLALATQIHAQLGRDTVFQRGNRGIDREGEESLRAADAPAVMMEFAIGQKGLSSLSVAGRPQRLAAAIARGVQRFDLISQAHADRRAANPPKLPAPPAPAAPEKKEVAQKGKNSKAKAKKPVVPLAASPAAAGGAPALRFKSSSALTSALVTDNFSFDYGVRLALESLDKTKVDPAKVELQVFAFDVAKGGELSLIGAEPPRFFWKSNEPNWSDKNLEVVDVLYRYFKTVLPSIRPTETPSSPSKPGVSGKTGGKAAAKDKKTALAVPGKTQAVAAPAPEARTTYGYVARLLYDGRFQDEISFPETLRTHLSRFAAITPQ